MTTFTTLYADLTPRATVRRLLRSRPGRFLAAYLEMTLAMVVGMGLFGAVWDSVWPRLTERPDAMALTMAFDMTLGMAAWMWVRRHAARHIAEMSGVMVLPFLVLLCPYWLGVLPGDALLTWGHVAMFALMAAYLAWRPHTSSTTAALTRTLTRKGHSPSSRAARISSVLLVGGAGLAVAGGILHPHDEPPNSHAAVFTEYAHSTDWVWVHDVQFVSAALVVAGFLLLGRALQRLGSAPALVRLGDAAAAATVALIAVNMAVDGIALKRAVDAWAAALPEDRASRFATTEAVRWLEWGVNSFFTILLGLTLLMFAAALLRSGHLGSRVRLAGVAGALAGGLLILNGLAVGAHGFEPDALPRVASGLYIVMALGIPPLDRAIMAAATTRSPASTDTLVPR
ncbi:MAG TPA: hypothetical protein VFJ94_03385 [Intrasporangium sp.]|uniref:hypothetical protein n=1 Tax=Intrasporangium sp. TaxID=1925024 RepID=UPI002D788C6D|nr:hypothetical protein [Intrasporangium sp.]HET7397544.1 hypothetical protein [Intrasporangium sp.]